MSSRKSRTARLKEAVAQLDNGKIAALLAKEAAGVSGHLMHALKKASRAAILWPEEATGLVAKGRSLKELAGVGSYIAKLIEGWIESPSRATESQPETQREFLTMAQAHRILAKDKTWRTRLKGDLQMHTVWSDGSATISEMAREAIGRSYEYISITDHTKGLKIAGGIDEKQLAKQGEEIKSLNQRLKRDGVSFTVLRSAEVNLSTTGEVDMSATSLRKLDVVLGAFHSALRKSEDQTDRYLAGVRNPCIQILGHPQCRVYNYRTGLKADWARVFGEAAKLNKALEIDGYADRQDLKLSLLKIARKEGCRISLGTDSHHPWQLAFIDFSLAAALLAKIPPERIINFMPARDLKKWVTELRASAIKLRRV